MSPERKELSAAGARSLGEWLRNWRQCQAVCGKTEPENRSGELDKEAGNMKYKLLVVEDDRVIAEEMKRHLGSCV